MIETLKGINLTGERAIEAAAKWGGMKPGQVRAAIRYYGQFRDEIDERVHINCKEAERQRDAWERAQAALG